MDLPGSTGSSGTEGRSAGGGGSPASCGWPASRDAVRSGGGRLTIADPDAEAAKDLIQRHFGPCQEIDRRYVGDITYVATWEVWAYLATVIDLASRGVVGWALADHMRTARRRSAVHGLYHPSARARTRLPLGPWLPAQYSSKNFAELARRIGVELSVGRKGECWENAVAESFFATFNAS
jgi:putative transposase